MLEMKIVYQGERGAYSEEAIIQKFSSLANPVPLKYLSDVFNAVEEDKADLGLVPVENTLEGSIVRTYDLLNEKKLNVVGEIILRVIHHLIVIPGVTLTLVKDVYSHPQALAQCRDYIEEHGYNTVAAYDTAGSVKLIKQRNLLDSAAIASRRAAEVYDMEILASGIETHPENYTRFLLIGKHEQQPTCNDRTSLAFIVKNRPGTLFKALEAFAKNGINLTKIESRPLIGKPWEYIFFIDVDGHKENSEMQQALKELTSRATSTKLFGSYPKAEFTF